MQIRKFVVYLACVMACAGLGCQKRVKTSTFVVPFTYGGDLTASSNGVMRWVSETTAGPEFTIHFVTTPVPCKEGNDIPGTPTHAAVCHVLPKSDGLYRYQIVPKGTTKESMKDVQTLNSHVDGCNGCSAVVNNNNNNNMSQTSSAAGGTGTALNSQFIVLACGPPASPAFADPANVTKVAAGEILEWSQDGPATNTWQVTVPDGVCSNGTTFGTQQKNAPVACVVNSSLKSGASYSYSITMKNCPAPAGTGQLTMQ